MHHKPLTALMGMLVGPEAAVILFWVSALLLVFTLINIFVAIILNSYEHVVSENPDANDSSQFVAMVLMQAKKTTVGAIAGDDDSGKMLDEDAKPHILASKMTHIDKEQCKRATPFAEHTRPR